MADELLTGKEGEVKWTPSGGSEIDVRVIDFSITQKSSIIDGTDSGSTTYREKEPGKFVDWSGNLTMFLWGAIDEIPINVISAATFNVETTKSITTRAGNIIITEVTENVPVEAEEAVKITVNFEGSGTLTKVNTAPA